jgi:hypothetical protein
MAWVTWEGRGDAWRLRARFVLVFALISEAQTRRNQDSLAVLIVLASKI